MHIYIHYLQVLIILMTENCLCKLYNSITKPQYESTLKIYIYSEIFKKKKYISYD